MTIDSRSYLPSLIFLGCAGLLASAMVAAQSEGPPSAQDQPAQQPQVTVLAGRKVLKNAVGSTAYGAPVEIMTLTRKVSYADLNLATPEGAAKLRRRIRDKASDACQQLQVLYPIGESEITGYAQVNQDCVANAIASAMPNVDALIGAAGSANPAAVGPTTAAAEAQVASAAPPPQTQFSDAQQRELQASLQDEQRQLRALEAQQSERTLLVTLGDSVLFTTGSATLEPGAMLTLRNVAQVMQQNTRLKVSVEGFADSRGSDAFNDALSQRRATTVAQALESDGVASSQVEIIGHGKTLPVATNDTPVGRQFNRRVALVFSGFGEQRAASTQQSEELR